MMEVEFRDPRDNQRPPAPAWLLVFSDMLALMLTFFVLLFSMSVVDSGAWQSVAGALRDSLNPLGLTSESREATPLNLPQIFIPKAVNLDYLFRVVRDKTADDPLLSRSVIERQDDRLVISLPSDMLFAVGGATLTREAMSAAHTLGSVLHQLGNQVDVNGHTDTKPMRNTTRFASNWELSLARAVAVANAIAKAGYTENVVAYGFADSRFNDMDPKLDISLRNDLARRVDIVIREHQNTGSVTVGEE